MPDDTHALVRDVLHAAKLFFTLCLSGAPPCFAPNTAHDQLAFNAWKANQAGQEDAFAACMTALLAEVDKATTNYPPRIPILDEPNEHLAKVEAIRSEFARYAKTAQIFRALRPHEVATLFAEIDRLSDEALSVTKQLHATMLATIYALNPAVPAEDVTPEKIKTTYENHVLQGKAALEVESVLTGRGSTPLGRHLARAMRQVVVDTVKSLDENKDALDVFSLPHDRPTAKGWRESGDQEDGTHNFTMFDERGALLGGGTQVGNDLYRWWAARHCDFPTSGDPLPEKEARARVRELLATWCDVSSVGEPL